MVRVVAIGRGFMEVRAKIVCLLGGDGLVAARHLWHYGYQPIVYYPKQSKNELYQVRERSLWACGDRANAPGKNKRLVTQLRSLDVPFTEDFPGALAESHHVVDAIFGFSFSGEVREPFPSVIEALKATSLPVTSVDAPSSWDIEEGPPTSGPGKDFHPTALVSLTAPKPLVKWFRGRHFLGGRFLSPAIAGKYGLDVPEYSGVEQVVELGPSGQKL
ncbi:MAG: hypothetical protein M1840_000297 [Geoglossum simile]|nr:MAG: hypothetical protein M1840_000297 [Geoglossum simile]